MKRTDFFTTDFYENPELTLEVLNKLVDSNLVADWDMYHSGTLLFMEVFESEKTKELLSKVISNLDIYKAYNNERYVSDETTEIGLCALYDEHTDTFKFSEGNKEIKWDKEAERFLFAEDFTS